MFLQPNLRKGLLRWAPGSHPSVTPCASEREIAMKCQMHHRFCSNPSVAFDKIRVSKKACTMREQQLNEAERIRKVHN